MGRKCIERVEAQQWVAAEWRRRNPHRTIVTEPNAGWKTDAPPIEHFKAAMREQSNADMAKAIDYERIHGERWHGMLSDIADTLNVTNFNDILLAVRELKDKAALPLGDALQEFPPLDQLPFESYLKHASAIATLQELGYTYSDINECWEAPPAEAAPPAPKKEKPGFTFYLFVLLASAAGAYLTIKYAVL